MTDSPCQDGAEIPQKEDLNPKEDLKAIHIAIFFDGTSNNMEQQMTYSSSFLNLSLFGLGKKIGIEDFDNLSEQDLMNDAESDKKRKASGQGYSNIAILRTLFNEQQLEEQHELTKWKRFYIEGSGASDVSEKVAKNCNGLGFGLGNTGVTALVCKGVRRTTDYINSLNAEIDTETEIHFYIFGFSRGATCARLFSHLITRDKEQTLECENEFKSFLPNKYFDKNRLPFLEEYKANVCCTTKIKREKIYIDFLGIYDTVSSIGFLKQKDGWYNPLQLGYAWAKNYQHNWHFKNVNDYGLYICTNEERLKNVCHICAQDEFRENFALVNIGKDVPQNAVEIIVPGCHSDVGGGYMSAIEQEISITRNVQKASRDCVTKLPLRYYNVKPTSDNDVAPISVGSLKTIGWIDNTYTNKRLETTITANEHTGVVYFQRFVKRGLSDIPLAMMLAQCKTCMGDIFTPCVIYDYKKTLEMNLVAMGDKMVEIAGKKVRGKRIWIVPGGAISSEKYKRLRLQYIHFTSTSSLGHIRNPFRNWELNKPFVASAGNLGNKPNFDLNGLMCRITYDGDPKIFGDEDYSQAVKYMYELGQGSEIKSV